MIEIKKGTEPKELLEYRQQKFASYADMPADVKKKVIKSLLLEQGHLCAYCMSRINADDGKHKVVLRFGDVQIFLPRLPKPQPHQTA